MARVSRRIKKTHIAPNHRGENFPRAAIAKAAAEVGKDFHNGLPPFRVCAYGDTNQALRLLTETSFFLDREDVFGLGTKKESFDGWAFQGMSDAQALFGILRRLGGISLWIVEVKGDDQ